jgi:hypothetical protein
VVLERAPVVERFAVVRLPAVERLERELAEPELERELDAPVRRVPPPELDLEVPLLLDPPLLACGMIPPNVRTWRLGAPYFFSARQCGQAPAGSSG